MNEPQSIDTPWSFSARHRIKVWRTIFVCFGATLILGQPAWSDHWISAACRLLGILFVCTAAMGRMWCALYISGRKSHELVTEGPYSLCRHPLYLLNLLGFVGVALLSESLVLVGLVVTAFSVFYPAVLRSEERLLRTRFPAYEHYMQHTAALLPRWRNYRSPSEWNVSVGPYLRNMADSLWFPLAGAAIELIDLAHESGLLAGRFTLY